MMLLALPGIAIARIATGASRSVLAMSNEFSRAVSPKHGSRQACSSSRSPSAFVTSLPLLPSSSARAPPRWWRTGLASRALQARLTPRADADVTTSAVSGAGDVPSTRDILTFSLPIAGSSLLTVLVMQADVLLLGTYVGRAPGVTPEAFGVFCAAAQVAGGLRKVRQVFDSDSSRRSSRTER
ncbi:MAG: hypothetical protein QM736_04710 [Vicinamibacterales bacterium]